MRFNKTSQEYKKLNNFIRNTMREKRISQEKLAFSLKLSQGSISKKLAGTTEWTVWELLNVFEILGVNFDYKE